jgi:hypothetical protein
LGQRFKNQVIWLVSHSISLSNPGLTRQSKDAPPQLP